jgi:hypothetical protein
MSIKELVADVTAITTDIGACAVTTAKIGGKQVTNAKVDLSIGKFYSGSWISGATTLFTGTSAFTVLGIWVKVTAGGAGDTLAIKTTAATIGTFTCSGTYSYCTIYNGLVAAAVDTYTATGSIMSDVSATGTIIATAAAGAAGKWYMLYIETQT